MLFLWQAAIKHNKNHIYLKTEGPKKFSWNSSKTEAFPTSLLRSIETQASRSLEKNIFFDATIRARSIQPGYDGWIILHLYPLVYHVVYKPIMVMDISHVQEKVHQSRILIPACWTFYIAPFDFWEDITNLKPNVVLGGWFPYLSWVWSPIPSDSWVPIPSDSSLKGFQE